MCVLRYCHGVSPFKPEIYLNNIKIYSSYLTENTLHLHYKNQAVK
jgi:hypothetical protein